MKIEKHLKKEMTLEKFAEKHDLIMQIYDRGTRRLFFKRYFAHFKNADIEEGGLLKSETGDGDTINEAIDDYARKISERTLVVDGNTKNDRRIEVPILIYQL